MWVYGETLHGVRSIDLDCTGDAPPAVCDLEQALFPVDPTKFADQGAFIVKNATSFEAYMGLRWEVYSFQHDSGDTTANLYLKAQAGILAVTADSARERSALGASGDAIDNHVLALGLIVTNGDFMGSYFETGFGRTDLFADRSSDRWKFDALLSFRVPGLDDWLRPFAQITIDTVIAPWQRLR